MRGEFTARYQDATDLADLARREHLNATTTTNYFFAHWSGWFGTRTEIRKWLLARVMPGVGGLTSVLGFRPAPALSESEVRLKSEARLRELKTLCDEYGARLTIVIPPTLAAIATEQHLRRSALFADSLQQPHCQAPVLHDSAQLFIAARRAAQSIPDLFPSVVSVRFGVRS
jgi:hypothetical protein